MVVDLAAAVEHYMALPYRIELIPDEGGWFVSIPDLPGCISQGDTPDEALEMIRDAQRGWLTVALQHGDTIPEPRTEAAYSGKFVVRLPRSMHRDLAEQAEQEGVSMNQYMVATLARRHISVDLERRFTALEASIEERFRILRGHIQFAPVAPTLGDAAQGTCDAISRRPAG